MVVGFCNPNSGCSKFQASVIPQILSKQKGRGVSSGLGVCVCDLGLFCISSGASLAFVLELDLQPKLKHKLLRVYLLFCTEYTRH